MNTFIYYYLIIGMVVSTLVLVAAHFLIDPDDASVYSDGMNTKLFYFFLGILIWPVSVIIAVAAIITQGLKR